MNLQEQISRIQSMMGVVDEYIYHGTSFDNAINVLNNGFDQATYWGDYSTAENYANSYDNPVLIKLELNDIIDLLEPNYTLINFYEESGDDDYKEIIDEWYDSNQTVYDSLRIFDSAILPPTHIQIEKNNIIRL